MRRRSPPITASCWQRRGTRLGRSSFSISARERPCCPRKKRSWKKRAVLWRHAESGRRLRADRFLGPNHKYTVSFGPRPGCHMKPGTITHTIAVLLSSASALFTHSAAGATPKSKVKVSKKSNSPKGSDLLKVDPATYTPLVDATPPMHKPGEQYPWKTQIVTTVF